MIPIEFLAGRLGNQMFRDAYIYAQYRDKEITDIYLQDEKYFSKYKDEIRARYHSGIMSLPFVAIHVRRGDYVNNEFYVDLFKDGYYERAMKEFPEGKFLVFSDDIEWCKKQAIFKGCSFSESGSEIDDLNMMASCHDIIIANSSFSWWAAYLSTAHRIIAPQSWYSDGVERTKCPDSWQKL